MPFDFKKEYREFYLPSNQPEIVTVPAMRYVAVQGEGDPNVPGGAYQQAIGVLYAVAYTLKMSYKTDHAIPGFFQYVVPPLEGFWQQAGGGAVDYSRKDAFRWISAIRLPDFVGEADFAWAVETAAKKKKLDCSAAELLTVEEGLCVQMLHLGPYDTEPPGGGLCDGLHRQAPPPRDLPLRPPEGRAGEVEDRDPPPHPPGAVGGGGCRGGPSTALPLTNGGKPGNMLPYERDERRHTPPPPGAAWALLRFASDF